MRQIKINFFSFINQHNSTSLQMLQIVANQTQQMYDRVVKSMEHLSDRQRRKSRILFAFVALCCLIATVAFGCHAFLTIDRYLEDEIQKSSFAIQNQNLFMPVVLLKLGTLRNSNSDVMKSPITINFQASLDKEKLPRWAFVEWHAATQHYLMANVINSKILKEENFTLEKAKSTVSLKKF